MEKMRGEVYAPEIVSEYNRWEEIRVEMGGQRVGSERQCERDRTVKIRSFSLKDPTLTL